jgi:prophage antirepressor-like protein
MIGFPVEPPSKRSALRREVGHDLVEINGDGWLVAADVCRVLGIGNVSQAIESLDDDERNTISIREGIRGNPNVNIISESGLYALVFQSRKPEAKRFRKWVTSEVLPSIRKYGYYADPIAKKAKRLKSDLRPGRLDRRKLDACN